MAKTMADYYCAEDGAAGAIPEARKAVAGLPLEQILSDRQACERDILKRYELPLIVFEGEAQPSVADGDGAPSIIVRQPVQPDDRIAEVLKRVDEGWVPTPVRLSYNDGHIAYKIRAGEPAFAKEEVRHSLEMVRQQEIEPRNGAVVRENEKLKLAIAQAIDERVTEARAASEHKRQVEKALSH
ncbi:MAG TPA: hypothetical protein VJZ91_06810 [Blastocatellia bacterium]|nr:hypothetical protein [Blastocatellia bacterium]